MRSVTFPILMGTISSGPLPYADPRRLPADALPRTRRCPPPIEDDWSETLFYLALVLVFTLTSWHFWP
jgi:hypothetical protein